MGFGREPVHQAPARRCCRTRSQSLVGCLTERDEWSHLPDWARHQPDVFPHAGATAQTDAC